MKMRSDPWILIGLLLSILLAAYNAFMEWRDGDGRVPPSPVPVPQIEEKDWG